MKYLFFIALAFLTVSLQAQSGTLIVKVKGFKSSEGRVGYSLFNTDKGFPSDSEKAMMAEFTGISDGTATIRVDDLAFGTYAISVFHDKNTNGELDTNFIGIPKESVGASNDASGTFGPPKFKDAKFDFTESGQEIVINLQHF
ncbi:DUF2141 domain-containing protein [Pontibacter sp. G13]|uniref:DUF2141 domain-containing protein n=1 Tax=Pontibacter sp. G13 TaxID=3074898 RepID=UPI0028897200|nr:DUF2141 domain-containing protein [Pontibacter sp. G13]WNJ20292.1 DUF2141 domain-containing protein [Pontibacter sp. G13]